MKFKGWQNPFIVKAVGIVATSWLEGAMMLTGKRPKEGFAGLQVFHGLPLRGGYMDLWQLVS